MQRKIITTGDGSKTIQILDWDEQYHSKHGAVQEAYHVFIDNGLLLFKDQHIAILEVGFGTGLNALITLIEHEKLGLTIEYVGVEAFPVTKDEINHLNYVDNLCAEGFQEQFDLMHGSQWEKPASISPNFMFTKQQKDFRKIQDVGLYHLIYFDAFGARVQPELWTAEVFKKMISSLKSGGVLVTYAAKGSVRRAMQEVGFNVERLPGPPGKREMLRAIKPSLA